MSINRRDLLRLAAGLPALCVGGPLVTGTEVDDDGPTTLETFREYCRIFSKAEAEWVRTFSRCTWSRQRYTEAHEWNSDEQIVAILGYGNPTACRNDRWHALDAIRAAGIEVLHYEPSVCGWAWVGFVVAEKADVEPLLERMVRIKPRYLK